MTIRPQLFELSFYQKNKQTSVKTVPRQNGVGNELCYYDVWTPSHDFSSLKLDVVACVSDNLIMLPRNVCCLGNGCGTAIKEEQQHLVSVCSEAVAEAIGKILHHRDNSTDGKILFDMSPKATVDIYDAVCRVQTTDKFPCVCLIRLANLH